MGQKFRDQAGNIWEAGPNGQPVFVSGPQQSIQTKPADPLKPLQVQGAQMGLQRDQAALQQVPLEMQGKTLGNERTAQGITLERGNAISGLVKQFGDEDAVAAYRQILPNVAKALASPDSAAGDLNIVYAYVKSNDPIGAVRGEDTEAAKRTAALVGQWKAKLGMFKDGDRMPPAARRDMVEALRSTATQFEKGYAEARDRYSAIAKESGLPAEVIIGPHEGGKYNNLERSYVNGLAKPKTDEDFRAGIEQRLKAGDDPANVIKWLIDSGRPPNKDTIAAIIANAGNPTPEVRPPAQSGFEKSVLGQGLAGANEGLASLLGAPADLSTAVINVATGGVNALAGTNIPRIDNPFLGSKQITEGLKATGSIYEPANHPFARRVGQSVGASAIPLGRAGYGAQLLMGAGGGLGAATAQQAFPGTPLAELGGELIGGGATAGGLTGLLKRSGQKQIEAAVPTVPQLKQQAGDLYQAAQQRGVTADPNLTRQLADDMRLTLTKEGQIGPLGKVTDADAATTKAFGLVEQYADLPMRPVEMDSVRRVLAGSRKSPNAEDQRLGGILLDQFDDWARPLAPEFDKARDISSRYLQAQDLEQAKELAGAQASQFTGSGFENALRTQYRALDRGAIKGSKHFGDDVTGAIEKVSRGTPMSNALRGLGRLAPTGPVSGMGSVVPALAMGAATDPMTGGMFGAALAGAGMAGRAGATHMGIRAADQAELVARNGGKLAKPVLSPEWYELMRRLGVAESAKYLPE